MSIFVPHNLEHRADHLITSKVKSFKDACVMLNISDSVPDFSNLRPKDAKFLLASYKLSIIIEALNEGWVPDWSNSNEYKYYAYMRFVSGGFAFYGCDTALTFTLVGSRLCLKSSDLVYHLRDFFLKELIDYFENYQQ